MEIFATQYILDNQHGLIDSDIAGITKEVMRLIQHECEDDIIIEVMSKKKNGCR